MQPRALQNETTHVHTKPDRQSDPENSITSSTSPHRPQQYIYTTTVSSLHFKFLTPSKVHETRKYKPQEPNLQTHRILHITSNHKSQARHYILNLTFLIHLPTCLPACLLASLSAHHLIHLHLHPPSPHPHTQHTTPPQKRQKKANHPSKITSQQPDQNPKTPSHEPVSYT